MNLSSLKKFTTAVPVLLFTLCNLTVAQAEIKPAALFGDHMVLQQGMSVPVWGWAEAGEQVTVSIAGQRQSARAGADGKWMIHLTDLRASGDPIEMTISGKNTIKIVDILVGEVWLGSGQSNMDFVVSGDMTKYPGMAQRFAGIANEAQEIAAANCPKIREFRVPLKTSELPLEDVAGKWQVCTPETVPGFSAIAYLFSRFAEGDSPANRVHHVGVWRELCPGMGKQERAGCRCASQGDHGRLRRAGSGFQVRCGG